jgi:uncharacterized protein
MKSTFAGRTIKILGLSDVEVPLIHNAQVAQRFPDTDLVIGCGDLSYEYMEYVISKLDTPLYYVRGNHSKPVEDVPGGILVAPRGGIDLHRKAINEHGLLLAGAEGSLRYRDGPYQYAQWEMWLMIFSLAPRLLYNRIRYGRFLDIFVTHASPWGIHDAPDLTHQGFKAFRWFLRVFQPAYHLHGHIHIYRPDTVTETLFHKTRVINTFGYRSLDFTVPDGRNHRQG